MTKASKPQKKIIEKRKIEQILITSPKPGSKRSPYFQLEEKYGVRLDFYPFIRVEGLKAREFRKQKINPQDYGSVILVSRNAVDHFFRICDEMKIKVSQDLKYFCASEAVALYLQKFVLYRKRKVFFSADGSSAGLVEAMERCKKEEQFLFPCSEHTKNDLSPLLKEQGFNFDEAYMYRTVSNDIKEVLRKDYDLIVFFSPFSVEAMLQNSDKKDVLIGAFGDPTSKAVEASGLNLAIKAPSPDTPSMSAALEHFLEKQQ